MTGDLMYLFPCALIEDFTFAHLGDTITTEEENKWSTTNAEATPSLDEVYLKNNKKSLKIAYSTPTARYVTRGIDQTDIDHSSWNNPFGQALSSATDDATWATSFGYWIYTDTDVYSDDNDLLKFGYETSDNDATTYVDWPSNVDTTGKWIWADQEIDMQYDNIDRFRFRVDHAGSGNIYINNLCLLKKSTSHISVYDSTDEGGTNAATGNFDWTNGLGLIVTSISRTLTGLVINAHVQPQYYRQCIDQLFSMMTTGVFTHSILRGGYHKVTSIQDLGYLKTYLFTGEFHDPETTSHYEMFAEPVVISNVTINHTSGKPHLPGITIEMIKYTGV